MTWQTLARRSLFTLVWGLVVIGCAGDDGKEADPVVSAEPDSADEDTARDKSDQASALADALDNMRRKAAQEEKEATGSSMPGERTAAEGSEPAETALDSFPQMSRDSEQPAGPSGTQTASGPTDPTEASSSKTVKSKTLAVRNQPSLDGQVKSFLHHGESVEIIEQRPDGWSRIGENLYVRTKYLNTSDKEPLGQGKTVKTVQSRALYIRSGPSADASIVGVLLKDDHVKIMKTEGGWSQVAPGKFVRDRYLSPIAH